MEHATYEGFLAGELRQVAQTPRRLAEAARLGFRRAVVPTSAPDGGADLEVSRAASLVEALALAGITGDAPDPLGYGNTMREMAPNPTGTGRDADALSAMVPEESMAQRRS